MPCSTLIRRILYERNRIFQKRIPPLIVYLPRLTALLFAAVLEKIFLSFPLLVRPRIKEITSFHNYYSGKIRFRIRKAASHHRESFQPRKEITYISSHINLTRLFNCCDQINFPSPTQILYGNSIRVNNIFCQRNLIF